MTIKNQFEIGETVYLVTDPDQLRRQILFLYVFKDEITYEVGCGTEHSEHHAFEISRERDLSLAMGINNSGKLSN
ncbi:hypothetical protein [Dyadobacter sp. LHD-138]|uniref:hypothetical protein n=1 Tax=Dyadobacter sp. LHD-138 TaxID=3071413 RepID=UPI0027DEFB94|nr:hypothetical protein [Dyadobacter sp. LHD-138]MDQ6482247.1 hypothetical protein [Dyadobacter sp. LHD-138]